MKYILSVIGVFAVLHLSFAQIENSKEVEQKVESLRKLMVDPDERQLTNILSEDLSYGHSSGRIEDRASLIQSLVSGESDFTSIEFSNQSVRVTGDVAVVRHHLTGSTNDKGKTPSSVKIGVLLVWVKSQRSWTLIARQAFKL